ncbi:MAG: zf-TFIIB domain-containing protein [Myxococcota bacterium]
MKCPRDGSTLETIKYEADIEVDKCPSCHGMWLDKGELEQIQETIEHDYEKELALEPDHVRRAYALSRPTHTGQIDCLKCGAEMTAKEYAYCSQVVVDICPDDHGMWLDAGEIQALEKFFERTKSEAREAEKSMSKPLWSSLLRVFKR